MRLDKGRKEVVSRVTGWEDRATFAIVIWFSAQGNEMQPFLLLPVYLVLSCPCCLFSFMYLAENPSVPEVYVKKPSQPWEASCLRDRTRR